MSLDFNRYESQLRCEAFCNCQNDLRKWHSSKSTFENLSLQPNQALIYSHDLRQDSVWLFKKGIHSLFTTLKALDQKSISYSWATIALYYAVHYFLRSSLASRGIGLIRNGGLYFLNDTVGSVPQKKKGKDYQTTHGGVINYYVDLYQDSDVLLSNKIDDMISYVWMKEIREVFNYRQNQFDEPTVPELWTQADNSIDESRFENLIETYIDDFDLLYCFQPEHALLALTLKRAFLTKSDLTSKSIQLSLTDDEIEYYTERITNRETNIVKSRILELLN